MRLTNADVSVKTVTVNGHTYNRDDSPTVTDAEGIPHPNPNLGTFNVTDDTDAAQLLQDLTGSWSIAGEAPGSGFQQSGEPVTAHAHPHAATTGQTPGDHHAAFVQADHDALANPHHSNANDHAAAHAHGSHSGIGTDDHHAKSHPDTDHSTHPSHASTTGQTADDHHTENHADTKHTTHPAHSATTGQTANDHHNQAHPDSDHTTHPSHANTTGQTANDHHNQSHPDTDHSTHPAHSATTGQTADDHHARDAITGINAQTAAYTLVAGDAGKLVTVSNAGAVQLSIPTDTNVNFAVGTVITVAQEGAGQVTIAAVTPGTTTVLSAGATAASPKCRAQYSAATLIKVAANSWRVYGDIA